MHTPHALPLDVSSSMCSRLQRMEAGGRSLLDTSCFAVIPWDDMPSAESRPAIKPANQPAQLQLQMAPGQLTAGSRPPSSSGPPPA